MSKYLLSTCETYRVDSENEANNLIEDSKHSDYYILSKYTNQFKERKSKGEVIDSYYKVTLTKIFTEEKEPLGDTQIYYGNPNEKTWNSYDKEEE